MVGNLGFRVFSLVLREKTRADNVFEKKISKGELLIH